MGYADVCLSPLDMPPCQHHYTVIYLVLYRHQNAGQNRDIKIANRSSENVLYGCETWALTLREEHKLKVFENRVLRRTFGLKRDEVKVEWRKMHNEV
jgi:hypothetical protein